MTRRSLVLEARFDTEPATWRDRLLPALQPLVTAVAPQTMFTCSPGGRVSRGRRFKWAQVEDSASMATTGDIALNAYDGDAPSTIKLCLRHNPAIDLRFQPPASLFAAIERERPSWDGVLPAMLSFLQFAASAPGVLHGGITLLDNLAQAAIEVTGTSTDIDKQAPGFIRRHEHDWRLNKQELGSSCRRLYWMTLLGPTLATAAGGAAAARAAGARAVTEVDGSLIIQAMDGPPRDSLDPEFLAATTRLRRWLWPHTFKNPLDAAGFEAEVGVAVSDAAPPASGA